MEGPHPGGRILELSGKTAHPRPRGQPIQTAAVTQKIHKLRVIVTWQPTALQAFEHGRFKVCLAHFLSVLGWFCLFTEEVNTLLPRAPGDTDFTSDMSASTSNSQGESGGGKDREAHFLLTMFLLDK